MNVIFYIEKCLIPKLSKNWDESENHAEYEAREAELQKHFDLVLNGLKCANLRVNIEISAKVLAAVLILYNDLLSKGPWASDKLTEYANKLSAQCESLYELKAADLLKNDHIFEDLSPQTVFDECMKALHLKLTSNELKKYPSLVEVYLSLIDNIEDLNNIKVKVKVMPISLYMIDDYNLVNKKRGLKCCKNILKRLEPEEFEGGNYYEVIHASLKTAFLERDIEITRLVLDCFQELLRAVPTDSDFKTSAADELFTSVLEQIQSEASLYRKAALFRFMRHLIEINGVNCVRRKIFQTVICYNLDVCCNKGVDDIMLLPIVVCLEEWVKHCWCAWRLDTGHNVLSTLLKVLYTCKEELVERIAKITATLITLCNSEEKQKIFKKLQETQTRSEQFNSRLNLVNKYIHVN